MTTLGVVVSTPYGSDDFASSVPLCCVHVWILRSSGSLLSESYLSNSVLVSRTGGRA